MRQPASSLGDRQGFTAIGKPVRRAGHLAASAPSSFNAGSASPDVPRILWIDDEVGPGDALMCLLALDGFRVDVAQSGTEGLARARAHSYQAVVLDLRLPDLFGLTVLNRLVRDLAAPPVLVVTGYYIEPEVEADARRIGAAGFRRKPLLDFEDLTNVLRSLLEPGFRSQTSGQGSFPAGSPSPQPGPERPAGATGPVRSRAGATVALLRSLSDPQLTSLEFVRKARLLPSVRGPSTEVSWQSAHYPNALPDDVMEVIRQLEFSVGGGHVPPESDHASEPGAERSVEGRGLKSYTGAGYREWRRLLRLRPALDFLAVSDEHVRQIAFRIGYEHASHFDRDFHRAFGVTPTEYRQLMRNDPFGAPRNS
jgi:CheY-like chemotaxis protein